METNNLYNTGMGTTPGMWDYLSTLLYQYNVKLPKSLNDAIYALIDNKAKIILKSEDKK